MLWAWVDVHPLMKTQNPQKAPDSKSQQKLSQKAHTESAVLRGVRQSRLRGRRAPENGRSGSSSASAFGLREIRVLGLWDYVILV